MPVSFRSLFLSVNFSFVPCNRLLVGLPKTVKRRGRLWLVVRLFLPASVRGLVSARSYQALKYSMYELIDFSLFLY